VMIDELSIVLGAVYKRYPLSGEGGYIQCVNFADKREGCSSNADVSTFGAKLVGFFEIYGPHGQGRRASAVILRAKRKE